MGTNGFLLVGPGRLVLAGKGRRADRRHLLTAPRVPGTGLSALHLGTGQRRLTAACEVVLLARLLCSRGDRGSAAQPRHTAQRWGSRGSNPCSRAPQPPPYPPGCVSLTLRWLLEALLDDTQFLQQRGKKKEVISIPFSVWQNRNGEVEWFCPSWPSQAQSSVFPVLRPPFVVAHTAVVLGPSHPPPPPPHPSAPHPGPASRQAACSLVHGFTLSPAPYLVNVPPSRS